MAKSGLADAGKSEREAVVLGVKLTLYWDYCQIIERHD